MIMSEFLRWGVIVIYIIYIQINKHNNTKRKIPEKEIEIKKTEQKIFRWSLI